MKLLKLPVIALLASVFIFAGCEKDDDPVDDDPTTTSKEITLVVKPMMGDEPLQLNMEYDMNGTTISFEFFKFYLSGIELTDDAGTLLADNEGKPILASTEQTEVVIGSTDANHMHMLQFDLGLDSLTNHQDPITAEGNLNDVQMHWNWNPIGGYKFTRFDYSFNGDPQESHAATDAMYREDVEVSVHDVSTSDDHIHIILEVDFEAVFTAVPLPNVTNHGPTAYNTSYMDILGSGSPFSVE